MNIIIGIFTVLAIFLYPLWCYIAYKQIQWMFSDEGIFHYIKPDGFCLLLTFVPFVNMIACLMLLHERYMKDKFEFNLMKFYRIKRKG